jgi:hypothetical protein
VRFLLKLISVIRFGGSTTNSDTIMTAFSQLTYTAVLLAVLAEQLYLPIPSVVFLMAAGELSARGEMRTSIIVSLGILACLAADFDRVLVRPTMGFSSFAAALPLDCRPARMLQECA